MLAPMPLLDIVVTLVVVGVILWLINRFIPMASSIKTILNAVVVIAVIWWLLSILGVVQPLRSFRVG
jgi:hypothetical protein